MLITPAFERAAGALLYPGIIFIRYIYITYFNVSKVLPIHIYFIFFFVCVVFSVLKFNLATLLYWHFSLLIHLESQSWIMDLCVGDMILLCFMKLVVNFMLLNYYCCWFIVFRKKYFQQIAGMNTNEKLTNNIFKYMWIHPNWVFYVRFYSIQSDFRSRSFVVNKSNVTSVEAIETLSSSLIYSWHGKP